MAMAVVARWRRGELLGCGGEQKGSEEKMARFFLGVMEEEEGVGDRV